MRWSRDMSAVMLAPREGACAHDQPTLLTCSLLRSSIEAHGRIRIMLLFGRRARALERIGTNLHIRLEVSDERGVTGSALGVRL